MMFTKCQLSTWRKIMAFGGHGILFPFQDTLVSTLLASGNPFSCSSKPFPSLSLLVELSPASAISFRTININRCLLLHRQEGTFPEDVGRPRKSFSPTFPSSCFFSSPELGFLSPIQSVPICAQVALPSRVDFYPHSVLMRLTWKIVPVTWLKSVTFF